MHRPVVLALLVAGCSFGVRGGVAATTHGTAHATGTLGVGVGKWGAAALMVTPEVALTASDHGAGVAGGTGFDVLLEQPSHALGFYAGPRFLAEWDGGGVAHEAVEAGVLLVPLSHRIDTRADAQRFLAPSWDARSTRRTQLGLSVRYDRVRRLDDSEPPEDRVMVGLTFAWSDVHGYTEPKDDEGPRSAPPAPPHLATQTLTTVIAADPQHVLAALVGLAEQPGNHLYVRSRTDVELALARNLGRREDTGAAVDVEVTAEIALAPVAGGTQLTAHLRARAPQLEADEAVRLALRDLPLYVSNQLVLLPAPPAPASVTMIVDARDHVATARWDDCAVLPTHASDPAFSADAPIVIADGHNTTVHFRGVTVGTAPGEPAWAVYAAHVNYDLWRPMCTRGGPMAAMVDGRVRLDGTQAYPRLAADAFAAADSIATPLEAATEAAHRDQALARLLQLDPRKEMPRIAATRVATGAWHEGRARFTFARTVLAEFTTALVFAKAIETIVIDVDLRDPSAPPVVVSTSVSVDSGELPVPPRPVPM